jgi:thioredoxin-related protein
MKKILLIVSLLISSVFADVAWVDYDDAIEFAEKENKLVMVMLSREGCSGCEYMKDIVFENDDISKILKENFISVHVDIQQDFIPSGLTYIGTPTFYFLDKNEKKLERIDGGRNAKSFMEILQKLVNKH